MKLSRKQQERYLSDKNYRRYLSSLRRKAAQHADLERAYRRYLREIKEFTKGAKDKEKFLSFSPNIEYLYNSNAKFKEEKYQMKRSNIQEFRFTVP